jgi:LPS-assembly protein
LFPVYAAETDTIHLNADKISYEEFTGVATAEGNVRLTDTAFFATAPYLEYDNVTQQITATSTEAGGVTLFTQGKRLQGDRLDYNLSTRRGKMSRPNGKVDVFYVKGSEIDVMPESETGRKEKNDEAEDELAAIWRGATLTTCNEPHPHYRLDVREVTIFPQEVMILHRPKVYLGSMLVMASPFDITLPLGRSNGDAVRQTIFPRIGYESDKGVGLGIAGSWAWRTGSVALNVIGWSEGIVEGDAVLRQKIGRELSVYAGIERAYDEDLDETEWRPRWGVDYSLSGWDMSARWTRKELLSVERKAGITTRHILERNPEIDISSPWFPDAVTGGQFRVFGAWGQYEENGSQTHERSGLGAQISGDFWSSRNFRPFYNVYYMNYMYDDDVFDSQEIVDARVGALWNIGGVGFGTAYLRQWVWGRSPMIWDAYSKREEIYQQIEFSLPTKSDDTSWIIGLRAAYDLMDEEFAEMVYKVAYDKHCLIWEAIYRDDRRGDDDWMGLSVSIKELPHGGLRLFGEELSDPFSH